MSPSLTCIRPHQYLATGKNCPPPRRKINFPPLFLGKRAENYGDLFFTDKGRKIYQIPPYRKGAKKVGHINWPDCRHLPHQTFNTPDFQHNRHLPHKTSTIPDLHHNILCGRCLVWWISCVVNVLLDTWWTSYLTHVRVYPCSFLHILSLMSSW